MEEKINVAAILKDKPQGTKLYDLLRNIDVELYRVHLTVAGDYIECISTNEVGSTLMFDYSKLGTEKCWLDGLQILFPSKEMRDWSKLAWNTGDILVNKDGNAHVIFEGFGDDTYETFNGNNYLWKNEGTTMCFGEYEDELPTSDFSKANKEDAQKYIHQIEKRLGYKLNFETLKIEKPEFKNGDIVVVTADFGDIFIGIIEKYIKDFPNNEIRFYCALDNSGQLLFEASKVILKAAKTSFATEEEKHKLFNALANEHLYWDCGLKMILGLKQKDELKPFDRVLVRDSASDNWRANLFGYIGKDEYYHCVYANWAYCIPYEGNESLLGTTKDVEG